VRRSIALLVLLLGLALAWVRADQVLIVPDDTLHFDPLPLPPEEKLVAHLGPFKLERAWRMRLGSWLFGGYSALVPLPGGELLAISDIGRYLVFDPPGAKAKPRAQYGVLLHAERGDKRNADVESATRDPRTGQIWLGLELKNQIMRLGPDWREQRRAEPRAMGDWGPNSGAEAMVRLADGRFIVLREGSEHTLRPARHEGLLFEADPTLAPDAAKRFVFEGPGSFDPVDMAQMPDGRVLVLMRTLAWPFPMRFAGRIAIGDPAQIRPDGVWKVMEVARLASTLPVDNFEGLAIVPRKDGKLTVWLISDDNQAKLQETLLWQLTVDPQDLPR